MGAALSIFVVLSLSVFVVRVASVSLRLTGLDDSSARFQALSAFTGTGFTTTESESIVNYPLRRRIAGLLMIIGNLGFVSVFATLVVSLVQTEGDPEAVFVQVAWLLGGLALLWFLMLNKVADRALCALIGRVLNATTLLGRRRFHRLLQLGDGMSVCEHPVTVLMLDKDGLLAVDKLARLKLTMLSYRNAAGEVRPLEDDTKLTATDRAILYGSDEGHEALGRGEGAARERDD